MVDWDDLERRSEELIVIVALLHRSSGFLRSGS
jgi:hypothetical protein